MRAKLICDVINESMKNKYFLTKDSKISGKGNFANKNMAKNTNLGLGLEKINDTGNDDKDYKRYDICTYTNHSTHPNIYYKKTNGKYYFFTLNDINKGEELLINYDKFDFDGKRDFN
jgi:hypothetical protein